MKRILVGSAMLAVALAVSGCDSKDKASQNGGNTCPFPAKADMNSQVCPVQSSGKAAAAGDAACPVQVPAKGSAPMPATIEGTVVQTLPAGRYIYIELNTQAGSVWIATLASTVTNGQKIVCHPETQQNNFESPSLKRKFEVVYFVSDINTPSAAAGMPSAMPPGHPAVAPQSNMSRAAKAVADAKVEVTPLEGGVTIATIAAKKDTLTGTEVSLRAGIVKYSAGIMGANWLHVKDSSTDRDLVVTTKSELKKGDTVVIRGKLERDVNLGSGYAYDLIIRDASVTADKPAQQP